MVAYREMVRERFETRALRVRLEVNKRVAGVSSRPYISSAFIHVLVSVITTAKLVSTLFRFVISNEMIKYRMKVRISIRINTLTTILASSRPVARASPNAIGFPDNKL